MKLSNREILENVNSLKSIAQKQLPVKASYAIAKNISHIESELKIYNEERQKLIDKYAKKDNKGNVKADKNGQIQFKEGCKEKWNKDIAELLNIENDIEIHKFNINELSGLNVSPAELKTIEYMIEE